jgi:hypothetical protein
MSEKTDLPVDAIEKLFSTLEKRYKQAYYNRAAGAVAVMNIVNKAKPQLTAMKATIQRQAERIRVLESKDQDLYVSLHGAIERLKEIRNRHLPEPNEKG